MGSAIYVVTYTAIARNVSAADLATSLDGIPRDTDYEATVGLQNLADVTVSFSNRYARRSISYTAAPNALGGSDATVGEFLTNLYTSKFSQLLRTPVTATPVSFVPAPAPGPILWVNAQYGVSASRQDWQDMSGSGHSLLQTNLANVGTFEASGFAPDVATMRWLGSTPTFMQSAAPLAFDEFTYLLTFMSPNASTAGILFERSVDSTAHSGELCYQSQGPSHSISARRNAVVHDADAGVNWGIDGNWHMVAYVYDRTNGGSLFLDANLIATFTPLSAEAVNATLYVAARSTGPALGVTGDYRELFVFPRALNQIELQEMAAYMNPQVGL